jgi:predicted TIM-barrel fold metal-dependent hydrolase
MIIDCHTHVGYENQIQTQSASKLLELMNFSKIDKSVIFPFGPSMYSDQSYSKINEHMAKLNKHSRFIAFGRINQLADNMFEEAEHIDSLGLNGIKFHTQRESLIKYKSFFKKLNKFDLPIIVHTGNNENSNVNQLVKLQFDGKIIIAHGGKDRVKDAIKIVNSHENIYIETSILSIYRTRLVIEDIEDKSKILFGSDAPFHHPELESKKIRYACTDKSLVKKILGKNMQRILK